MMHNTSYPSIRRVSFGTGMGAREKVVLSDEVHQTRGSCFFTLSLGYFRRLGYLAGSARDL